MDFESWTVEGKTEQEAKDKAIAKLKTGYTPSICNLEDSGDGSDSEGECWGDGWFPAVDKTKS